MGPGRRRLFRNWLGSGTGMRTRGLLGTTLGSLVAQITQSKARPCFRAWRHKRPSMQGARKRNAFWLTGVSRKRIFSESTSLLRRSKRRDGVLQTLSMQLLAWQRTRLLQFIGLLWKGRRFTLSLPQLRHVPKKRRANTLKQ